MTAPASSPPPFAPSSSRYAGLATLGSSGSIPAASSATSQSAEIETASPIFFDPYDRNRSTGSFILIDEASNDTVGAGMVVGANA